MWSATVLPLRSAGRVGEDLVASDLSTFLHAGRVKNFGGMGGSSLVQDNVANHDQELVVTAAKAAGEREIAGLGDDAFPDKSPELLLRYPEFLFVITDYFRVLFDRHSQIRQP